MARSCTVCTHERRTEIEAALVRGQESNRRIAPQYGLSEAAVRRHVETHLPARLVKAHEAAEVANADDLLGQVRSLHGKALTILAKAEDSGDLRAALLAIGQARSTLEFLAKLLGELDERPQVNVLVSPEWLSLRGAILAALQPFPEARAAVAARLTSGTTRAA